MSRLIISQHQMKRVTPITKTIGTPKKRTCLKEWEMMFMMNYGITFKFGVGRPKAMFVLVKLVIWILVISINYTHNFVVQIAAKNTSVNQGSSHKLSLSIQSPMPFLPLFHIFLTLDE
jgi:hypothetical protein